MPIDPSCPQPPKWRQFAQDNDGAVSVIVALLLVVLFGFAALGVDTASLYRERAKLQSLSDVTALSTVVATDSASARATHVLTRNGMTSSTLETLETGRFLRNPALPPQARFIPLQEGAPGINAVRVGLQDNALLHFARIFTDDTHVRLTRKALASRTGAASFSLDSHLATLDGAALDDLIISSFGVSASVGAGDLQVLATTQIDMREMIGALDRLRGQGALNPAEILDATVPVQQIIAALRSVLPPSAAAGLVGFEQATGEISIPVAAIVGGMDTALGLTVTEFLADVDLTARDVLEAVVQAARPDAFVRIETAATVPGVLSATTTITAGEPPAQSGLIALGERGVQLKRAATRMQSDIVIAPAQLGDLGSAIEVTSVHLPLYVELAGAAATLTDLSCDTSDTAGIAAEFQTAHSPLHPGNGSSLAALYLGSLPEGQTGSDVIDPATLEFADLLTLDIRLNVPLLPDVVIPGITIQARSLTRVGNSGTETVSFTHQDILDERLRKQFGTEDLLSTAVTDLLSPENTEFRVKPSQSGLVSGIAAPVVASLLPLLPDQLLTTTLSPVDAILDTVLQNVGLTVGTGEISVTGHHCETARLWQ